MNVSGTRSIWSLGAACACSLALLVPPAEAARASAKPAARPVAPAAATVMAKPGIKLIIPAGKSRNGVRKAFLLVPVARDKLSFGHVAGLQETSDPLELKSSVALVVDQDTNQVLLSKNPQAVLPIASITKLMTALVVTEARLPADEPLAITDDDVDTEKFSHSRLAVGTTLSRGDLLHLALMSSENRAAHALGRSYPGGLTAFVAAMNRKAAELGMTDTHYVEPTGLSSQNQSSARDLTLLVKAAYMHPIIRELSTSTEASMAIGARQLQFRTTNGLVRDPKWDIGLQKTGYISEAGRCVVMSAQLAGRRLILVLLDSAGKYSRIGDAERIRKWLATTTPGFADVARPRS